MISAFPWLPIGTALPNGALSGRRLEGGAGWQLCDAGHGGTVLLLRPGAGPAWWADEVNQLAESLATVGDIVCLACTRDARPQTIGELAVRNPLLGKADAVALVRAMLAMAARQPDAGWSSALYLPGLELALATAEASAGENRRACLLAALSGGIGLDDVSPARLVQLNGRLDLATARTVLDLLAAAPASPASAASAPEGFVLPGQPALQALLREQVLDVLHRPAEYARLGVSWPGGVLLAGPPGSGKSFAAARLAAFLGWTLHEISVAGVGSMWLHETPRQLARAFAQAAASPPGVILLEELDALGRKREGEHGPGVEEVNTLLREVETAAKRRLLVIGTTNRLDSIDRALLRHGRFDLVFTMDYPDATAAAAMLQALLDERPHAPGMDVAAIGRRLARRPASDLAWVVDQAARLAVRGGRGAIDELLLARAAADLAPIRGE